VTTDSVSLSCITCVCIQAEHAVDHGQEVSIIQHILYKSVVCYMRIINCRTR